MVAIVQKIPIASQPNSHVEVDWSNPITRGLIGVSIPMSTSRTANLANVQGQNVATVLNAELVNGRAGRAWRWTDGATTETAEVIKGSVVGGKTGFEGLGTDGGTIFLVRIPTDTTDRVSGTGSTIATSTYRLGGHWPYSDGTIYWDYGADRLTWGGYSKSTSVVDYFCFSCGIRGMEIWYNKKLVASSGTIATRLTENDNSNSWTINYGNGPTNGDAVDVFYNLLFKRQLQKSEIISLYANEHQVLRPDTSVAFLSVAGGGPTSHQMQNYQGMERMSGGLR